MRLPGKKQAAPPSRRRPQPRSTGRASFKLEFNTGRDMTRETIAVHGRRVGKYWAQRLGLLVLLVVTLVSLVRISFISTTVSVVAPRDSKSALLRSPEVYQDALTRIIASSPANRNKLTINSQAVQREFRSQFPEVASASLALPIVSNKPILYVEPSEPVLLLSAQNGSFVVDATGRVLLPSTQLPPNSGLTLPTVNDQSSLVAEVGKQALPRQAVLNIRTILGQLSERGVNLTGLTLPPGSSQLEASVVDQPYKVKFNLQSDNAREQAGSLLATQAELARTNVKPSQYIDVRLAGRAYYK